MRPMAVNSTSKQKVNASIKTIPVTPQVKGAIKAVVGVVDVQDY